MPDVRGSQGRFEIMACNQVNWVQATATWMPPHLLQPPVISTCAEPNDKEWIDISELPSTFIEKNQKINDVKSEKTAQKINEVTSTTFIQKTNEVTSTVDVVPSRTENQTLLHSTVKVVPKKTVENLNKETRIENVFLQKQNYSRRKKRKKITCSDEDDSEDDWAEKNLGEEESEESDYEDKARFKCRRCNFWSLDRSSLMRHIKTTHISSVTGKKERQKSEFYKSNLMQHHISSVCRKKKKKKRQKEGYYEDNDWVPSGKRYIEGSEDEFDFKCHRCSFKANGRSSLMKHIKSAHVPKKCSKCSYKTTKEEDLEAHIEEAHEERGDNLEVSEDLEARLKTHEVIEEPEEEKLEVSETKLLELNEEEIYAKDKSEDENEKEDWAELIVEPEEEEEEENVSVMKWYWCSKCSYKTTVKQDFKRHQKDNHDNVVDGLFKCDKCPYTSSDKKRVDRHFSAVHDRKGWLQCTMCPHQVKTQEDLQKHYQVCHPNDVIKFVTNSVNQILQCVVLRKSECIEVIDMNIFAMAKCRFCNFVSTTSKEQVWGHIRDEHNLVQML